MLYRSEVKRQCIKLILFNAANYNEHVFTTVYFYNEQAYVKMK